MKKTDRAEIIHAAIEATRDKETGRITPKGVVNAARDKKNPLHREFGRLWDAKFAQQKALEDRAGELIRYVTVLSVVRSRKIRSVAYVKDPRIPATEPGHVSLTSAQLNHNHAMQIMLSELDRCEHAIDRARNICDVLDATHPGVAAQLQSMLEAIVTTRTLLKAA